MDKLVKPPVLKHVPQPLSQEKLKALLEQNNARKKAVFKPLVVRRKRKPQEIVLGDPSEPPAPISEGVVKRSAIHIPHVVPATTVKRIATAPTMNVPKYMLECLNRGDSFAQVLDVDPSVPMPVRSFEETGHKIKLPKYDMQLQYAEQPDTNYGPDPDKRSNAIAMYDAEVERIRAGRAYEDPDEAKDTTVLRENEVEVVNPKTGKKTKQIVRAPSPGEKYDQHFIQAEVGVAKPSFKAAKYRDLFAQSSKMTPEALNKLMSSALNVERTLNNRYRRAASTENIRREMILQHRNEKRAERQAARLTSAASSQPGSKIMDLHLEYE